MTTNPKHQTVVETTPEGEDVISIPVSLLLNTMSFHEKLGSERTEREIRTITSRMTLLSDLMKCMDVISSKVASEVQITITTDRTGEPKLIRHRYQVSAKDYGRQPQR